MDTNPTANFSILEPGESFSFYIVLSDYYNMEPRNAYNIYIPVRFFSCSENGIQHEIQYQGAHSSIVHAGFSFMYQRES